MHFPYCLLKKSCCRTDQGTFNPPDVNTPRPLPTPFLYKKAFQNSGFLAEYIGGNRQYCGTENRSPDWTFSVRNNWLFDVGRVIEKPTAHW
jgi:hypothetical protein